MGKLMNTSLFLSLAISGFTQYNKSLSLNINISDTILISDYVNFATLVVDYDTYEYEGGNISYYEHCEDCTNDSIPFQILVNYPGDFGNITYRIQNTVDTVFFASIIWMGTGQIYHPESFSSSYPFNKINNQVEKPGNIEYYDKYGSKVYADSAFIQSADSAWGKIDSLRITKLFSENNYKVGIYLYPPSDGVFNPMTAKWIIFLYLNDYNSLVHPVSGNEKEDQLFIYPNPCKDYLTIECQPIFKNMCQVEIMDLSGRSQMTEQIYLSKTKRLDVSSFEPGVYILRIKNYKLLYHSIFIKN